MKKIAPSKRFQEGFHAFFDKMGDIENGSEALSELVRRAAQLAVQETLEAEQLDFIGRERYERGYGNGYRSGFEPGWLKTAEGRIELSRPQVRDASEPYRSKLYDFLRGNSDVLDRLSTEMYVRGLSTQDIEDSFTDERGYCLLSRTAVSEISEVLWEEYEAFQTRDLSDIPVLYLFLDGLYEPLRVHGIRKEAIFCAWAITTEGEKDLLSLALGKKESYENWWDYLRDMVKRDLPTPLTITTDCAPGLLRAVDEVWSKSLRLRCWVHKMRNILAKVLESMRAEIKAHLVAIRDATTL